MTGIQKPTSEYLAAFHHRILRDAFQEADRAYWHRRAAVIEAARPRPTDFVGRASAHDIREQSKRMTDIARACRARAGLTDGANYTFSQAWAAVAGDGP